MIFENRYIAGKLLGERLKNKRLGDPVIFGLARGGIVTAAAVAEILNAPLDIIVVRKLTSPLNPEFGFGAIAPLQTKIIDQETVLMLRLSEIGIKNIIKRETKELNRRLNLYRLNLKYPQLSNKTTVLVDDGIATGVSIKAAIAFLKKLGSNDIIVAVPVCAPSVTDDLKREDLRVLCLKQPADFMAVGEYYGDFEQITDEDVIELLKNFYL